MKRREFIRGGIGTFMAGLTLPLDRFIADYKPENVSKVNRLEELGEIIERGQPAEVLYDLGEGEERTELLVTYIDGNNRTTRIASSPKIRLYEDKSGTLMDITDSDEGANRYSYRSLRPLGAEFEMPSRPSDESGYEELGDLTVNLKSGGILGISHYARGE